MKMVLLGPPGAGKGTQAMLIQKKFGSPHISSGDLLRASVRHETELGRVAKQYMDRGELVPDQLVVEMLEERVGREDCRQGFILDGFPRNVAQADALDRMLAGQSHRLDHVVSLTVPSEDLVCRLSGRRTCRECGAMFHVTFDAPRRPDFCDHCGGALMQRSDDREEVIRARLEVYDRETAPLLDYYRERQVLREVPGVGTPDEIFHAILARMDAGR